MGVSESKSVNKINVNATKVKLKEEINNILKVYQDN